MKSMTKKLALLLVAALLVATMLITFVACGSKDDSIVKGEDGYFTVQVLMPDGTPAAGVMVQLCVEGEDGKCYFPETVDADGLNKQQHDEDALIVHFDMLPEGYKVKDADLNKRLRKGYRFNVTLEKA